MAPPRILISRSLRLYQRTRLSSFTPSPLTALSALRLPSTSLIHLPSSPLRLTITPFNLALPPFTAYSRVHFPAHVFFSTANNKKDTPSLDQEEAESPPTPLTTDGESVSYEGYQWSDDEGEEFTNVFEMIKRKLPLPDSWPDFKKQAYESRIRIERFLVAKGYLKSKPIPERAPSNTDLQIRLLKEVIHQVKQRMPMPPVNSRRSRQSSFATRLKKKGKVDRDNNKL